MDPVACQGSGTRIVLCEVLGEGKSMPVKVLSTARCVV